MSVVTLEEVKAHLRVVHDADDGTIQVAIDGAEAEAMRYLGRTQLPTLPLDYPPEYASDDAESPLPEDVPSSEDPIADDVRVAIYLLVQATYAADSADEMMKLRAVAEMKLHPYRAGLGV